MNIILGSGSPRRKNILEGIFGSVTVVPPSVDESILDREKPDVYTERITNLKMDAVLSAISLKNDDCVITSDTVVLIDDRILGKPESAEEAFSMLKMLSGNEHTVLTGLCVVINTEKGIKRMYSSEKTQVFFNNLTDDIINEYLGLVNYKDKAGSYAIQEHGERLVKSITGSMTNVIGFPLRLFFRMLISPELS